MPSNTNATMLGDMPGYSGTPLPSKLGIRAGASASQGRPPDYLDLLEPLPERVAFVSRISGGTDLIHVFSSSRAELGKTLVTCRSKMRPTAVLWVSWPKKSAKVPTDITEDTIRELALPLGFVDEGLRRHRGMVRPQACRAEGASVKVGGDRVSRQRDQSDEPGADPAGGLSRPPSINSRLDMPLIELGKKAPAFHLKDQSGKTHRLADYAGRPVVLYFYPKDDTPGCTKEACAFEDGLPRFKNSKAVVLGVSILDTASKARFAEKHGLSFPLLADEDHTVAAKYGVWQKKSLYGRSFMGNVRTTYLIDRAGKVAKRWDNVKVDGHADAVAEAVEAL